MIKKIILLIVLMLVLDASAWAVTKHTDYATEMEIKNCNDCHTSNNITPNHGSYWVKEHRLYREKLPSNCNDCHQQSFCLDCHKGGGIDSDLHVSNSGVDYMPKSHRTDFREIHPIKAADNPQSCYRCHDAKKFCYECHSKFNPNDLRILSHRKGWSDLRPGQGGPKHSTFNTSQCQQCHPNSVLPKHEWSASHAREARKNLTSCETCHPDGDVCIKCHSSKTGLKISPHPRNWGKVSGRLSRASNDRTCIKCH